MISPAGPMPRTSGVPSLVVAGRLLLLLVAAAAFVSALVLARAHDRAAAAAGAGAADRYVCPMHPEVASTTAGDCPICGMALERVTAPVAERAEHGAAMEEEKAQGIGRVEQRTVAEEVRAAAWLGADGAGEAVLYDDDLVGLAPGEGARFFGGSAPGMGVDVHLAAEPPVRADDSTVKVRFHRDARSVDEARGPTDVGSLRIARRPRDLLVVPSSAVLYSGQGPYVLAGSGDEEHGDTFTRRPVTIGRILDSGYEGVRAGEAGFIVILAGLREGERVVTANTFFMDAERRLEKARGAADEVKP